MCTDFNDILSVRGMLPYLLDESVSDRIIIHATLESTNDTAKELAISGARHGTVVMADYQTAGKGRYGRSFFSPPGHGVYMSFILHQASLLWGGIPTLATAHAAVSVCEAIEATTGKTPQIKWVNDVLLDGKKICGILTEAVTDSKNGIMPWIVVGIGVNFITPGNGYPEEIRNVAGSLFSEGNPSITRSRLAAELVNRMLSERGDEANVSKMLDEYRKRLVMLGKTVTVSRANSSFEATAIDIDDTGRLIVKKDNGEILSLDSGEISITSLLFTDV